MGIFESVAAQLTIVVCFQSLVLDMAGNVGTSLLPLPSGFNGRKAERASKAFPYRKETKVGFNKRYPPCFAFLRYDRPVYLDF